MKTSVAISWQDTDFGAVATGDAAGLVARARTLGYDAVELAVCDPAVVDMMRLEAALGGMPVCAIGTGQAFLTDGLSISSPDDDVRRSATARLEEHCRLAAKLKCPFVIIGLIRGKQGKETHLIDSLRQVCETARSMGIRLVIEPINRYETSLINTAAQGMDLIERVGADNLGLLLDTFHMNIEEANPAAGIILCRERLWHLHLADSNRLAPGLGHMGLKEIVGVLQALGYHGYTSAEIVPHPDAATAMELALQYMRRAVPAS